MAEEPRLTAVARDFRPEATVGQQELWDTLVQGGSLKWAASPELIGAWVAESDFGTSPAVQQAVLGAIKAGNTGYHHDTHVVPMQAAFAGFVQRNYGWEINPERVKPIADVITGLIIMLREFSTPGSPVIVPTPAYMPFLSVPPSEGHPVIEVPMLLIDGRWEFDLPALEAAYDAGAEVLVLCSPHNPIGAMFDRDQLAAISELVERRGGRVYADEVHAPLVLDGSTFVPYATVSEAASRHAITAYSASKAWNIAGLKCAQLILGDTEEDNAIWERIGFISSHGASTIGILANTAAYNDTSDWLSSLNISLARNQELLRSTLEKHAPEIRFVPSHGSYLAWLDCSELGLEKPADFFATEAGVRLVPGSACGAVGKDSVRFNFALAPELMELAVARMATALSELRSSR